MAKGQMIIYQKPTCSTCRETVKLVKTSGKNFVAINYYEQPFTKPKLKGVLKKAGLSARDILRRNEEVYKKLRLARKTVTEDQLLDLMVKHPDLIQRPLVELGGKALLARPADLVKTLLR